MLPLSKSSKIIAIEHVRSLRLSLREEDFEYPIKLPVIMRRRDRMRKIVGHWDWLGEGWG